MGRRADAPLDAPPGAVAGRAAGGRPGDVLTVVREALDDDLDTPAAFAAIDAAAARDEDVGAAAALLGVVL